MKNKQVPAVETFDFLSCPLRGSNLLEASAGTGKTFSLMFLYLRLILEKQLSVKEILVATFTNAAKAEIRQRIYAQLKYTAQLLNELCQDDGDITARLERLQQRYQNDGDFQALIALLHHLLTRAGETVSLDDMAQRLRLAQSQFDYAQIYSIDGFARQLLVENTDVLGSYVPEETVASDSEHVEKIYLSLAKANFSDLAEQAETVAQAVATQNYEHIIALLTDMVTHYQWLRDAEQYVLADAEEKQTFIQQLINGDHSEAITAIRTAIEAKQLDGRTYKMATLEKYTAQLGDESSYLNVTGGKQASAFLRFFSRSQLLEKAKNDTLTFDYPLCYQFDRLITIRQYVVGADVLCFYQQMMHLAGAVNARLPEQKAADRVMTFNDITAVVAASAEHINTPIKAALIDEAQDTNHEQLALFKHLFMSANHTDKICFFVGDPKQAIYGFRGANIYSYLAIQDLVTQRYVLDTNYRSSASLNDSINAWFAGQQPFFDSRIDYLPIKSHKDNQQSTFSHALTLLETADNSVQGYADSIALRIHRLLNEQQQIEGKALQAGDIAVLVRSASQGQRVKQALAAYGRAASFVDKRSSVYDADEAKLLYWLLTAMLTEDPRIVRALMLTPLLGGDAQAVRNPALVVNIARELGQFAQDYEKRGFAVMFYRVMHHFDIGGRLLLADDGKRKLTNFIQLFECLQMALQDQALSLYGLCDWLAQRIHFSGEESELRLEDDNAIVIMTMHSAKGLEFPVVCLPYFDYSSGRTVAGDKVVVSHQEQQATLKSIKNQSLTEKVAAEEAAEQARLAYVALTRAKYHNIIVVSNADKPSDNSMYAALLATLTDTQSVTQAAFTQCLSGDVDSVEIAGQGVPPISHYQAKTPKRSHHSGWLLESFSRLQHHEHKSRNSVNHHVVADESPLLLFPKGPNAGNALHAMYEYYMQHRQHDADFVAEIEKQYQRYLRQPFAGAAALAEHLKQTTLIPLADLGFCLHDIPLSQQSIEMKFFMHLSPKQRQHWYRDFGYQTGLESEGFVHGYIDYCFAYNDKYYVLDYKSNYLGQNVADYTHAAMQAEMHAESYQLQAKIYTVALCKHLLISDEVGYEEKIGGYVYLFVRGMNQQAETQQNGVYYNRFAWQDIAPLIINVEGDDE